jgi:hypothetical protein
MVSFEVRCCSESGDIQGPWFAFHPSGSRCGDPLYMDSGDTSVTFESQTLVGSILTVPTIRLLCFFSNKGQARMLILLKNDSANPWKLQWEMKDIDA